MNPYSPDISYVTQSFCLRPVKVSDAEALLKCYSDPEAVKRINADNCTSDFYYTTLEQMRECVTWWISAVKAGYFQRLAIVPKGEEHAVGTVEMFGSDYPELGRAGVLRVDIAMRYEKPELVRELVELGILSFMDDFDVSTLLIKADNTPERAQMLLELGFLPTESFRPGMGYLAYMRRA